MERGKDLSLPKLMEPLAPFIKPRQEALEIRRILSIFLAQNIRNPHGEFVSATSLVLPPEGTQVGFIAPQLAGIRRSYLEALQAHIAARESYNHLSMRVEEDTIKAKRRKQREIEHHDHIPANIFHDYLYKQRRYQKLIILRDSLELLAYKDAAKPDYLDPRIIMDKLTPPPELPPTYSTNLLALVEDETQSLVSKLEKAVLRAQNALENEKVLLTKAKERYQCKALAEVANTRISALHRTRDELIEWLESRLASPSQVDDPSEELPIPISEDRTLDIDQRIEYIHGKYSDYLEARKTLLAFMSDRSGLAIKMLPVLQEESSAPLTQTREIAKSAQEAKSVLPALTQYLIPAANDQVNFLEHESHLSRSLVNEEQETIRALEILAEESHLLSKHQISAPIPPFQKECAGLSLKSLHSQGLHRIREARTITQAQGWASAASAARSLQESAIEDPLRYGEKEAFAAKNVLQELQEMLGFRRDHDEVEGPEIKIDTRDAGTRKDMLPKEIKHSKGVWAGLNGKLGIDDNKARERS